MIMHSHVFLCKQVQARWRGTGPACPAGTSRTRPGVSAPSRTSRTRPGVSALVPDVSHPFRRVRTRPGHLAPLPACSHPSCVSAPVPGRLSALRRGTGRGRQPCGRAAAATIRPRPTSYRRAGLGRLGGERHDEWCRKETPDGRWPTALAGVLRADRHGRGGGRSCRLRRVRSESGRQDATCGCAHGQRSHVMRDYQDCG